MEFLGGVMVASINKFSSDTAPAGPIVLPHRLTFEEGRWYSLVESLADTASVTEQEPLKCFVDLWGD